jgi:prolyl-tRNA editing enzyme YbaK/EbsC (Cys-tRNA(Pro) deacylase)
MDVSSSTDRVAQAAAAAGLAIDVQRMPESTRTADEAARTCGCSVAQIVKSLVFERVDTGALVLLLIAGDRQADLTVAARVVGADLVRADPKRVRAETGFAIGGVAPMGHLVDLPVFIDPSLLDHDAVWAAAGAPNAVFRVDPRALQVATSAVVLPA